MNKDTGMKYSIITVTFNCENTIERTINSVLSQDYAACEYIIIDGASTDGTTQVIEKFRDDLDFFVSEPDSGVYAAMNKGLSHATGDLVLFLNGDDYLVDATALTRMSMHYSGDETIVIGRLYQGDKLSPDNTMTVFKSKYYGIFYPHQATFVPKVLYDKLGGFDEKYSVSADFEWICRAMHNGYQIEWVDEIVSVFSLGGMSASLQCIIDEYNVSVKYMKLNNDPYLQEMICNTKDIAKSYFFKMICDTSKYYKLFSETITNIWSIKESPIEIWGAGFWGRTIIKLLKKCGYVVDCIFDSSVVSELIEGVSVKAFDIALAKKIIVTTEKYDTEIVGVLQASGLNENVDFISYHRLRDMVVGKINESNDEYRSFLEQTGLILTTEK